MRKIVDIISVAVLCSIPLFQHSISMTDIIYIDCCISIAAILLLFINRARLSVNAADLTIAIWVAYLAFNTLFIKQSWLDIDIVFIGNIMMLSYLIARYISNGLYIAYGILISALIQVVISALQIAGVAPSNHLEFIITGTFSNPTPLACLLAMAFVVAFALGLNAYKANNKRKMWILLIYNCTILPFIVLADSRAAWVASIVGLLFCISSAYNFRLLAPRRKIIVIVSLLILFIPCLILTYHYKLNSANGRLHIWSVSSEMVNHKPILGHGIGAFAEKYMYYQADYFDKNPNSSMMMVADNIHDPYNEVLRILIEQGLIGLSFFAILMLILFTNGAAEVTTKLYQALLLTLLVFSLFSYPTRLMALALFYGVCCGSIASRLPSKSLNAGMQIFVCLAIVIVEVCFVCYTQIHQAQSYSARFLEIDINNRLSDHNYNTVQELEQIKRLITISPSESAYTSLGNAYLRSGRLPESCAAYNIAIRMVPIKIIPRYQLFNAKLGMNDKDSALIIARQISRLPTKIYNTATLRIKNDINDYINSNTRTDTN